jgi:hypothetical protein
MRGVRLKEGHYFFADDYVGLKTIEFMVQKGSIKNLPEKIK